MKYIKSYIFLTLMVVSLVGCKVDDLKDDVNDLKDRVALIEEQVNLLNSNLEVVSYILDSQNRTINSVDDSREGQYVITLSDGSELVLTIGKEGVVEEPVITIGEDDNWYINGQPTGVQAVGKPGDNGQGIPQFRVNNGNWEVRFNGGEWKPVEGGTGVATSSLGDQFFDSAKVEGDVFVVTMIDGGTYSLPIVKDLVCSIVKEGAGEDGFFTLEKGERKAFTVTVKGDNPTLTYPAGWRATLSTPDSEGKAELMLYAPVEIVSSISRAAADNTSDVTIRVQKGTFWAVDKIKVKTPKVYNNDWERYNDGISVEVGGLEINEQDYGKATLISSNQEIENGGVYFVEADNVTLTYKGKANDIKNLIILPASNSVSNIKFEIPSQVYFSGSFVCKRINIINKVSLTYTLRLMKGAEESSANVILEDCILNGLVLTKGFLMPAEAGEVNLSKFLMLNSDVRVEGSGAGLYLISNISCEDLCVNNTQIYSVEEGTSITDFKILNGNARWVKNLILKNNTFIDVQSSGASAAGLIWASKVTTFDISGNLYWLSSPQKASFLLRNETPNSETSFLMKNNYGYGNGQNMKVYYTSGTTHVLPDESLKEENEKGMKAQGLFDISQGATFDKSNGKFIPSDDYKDFGAQR